jgi:response regulator RpfG family c-di-GMP phosphodiesterase
MKTHTTAGAQIITSAIDMVSEDNSGYLFEARNLAHYHHEKWNGSGYPDHLSGTDIPLSARIMAVADVFDALVSKRSYKDGFPFEKAMAIIKEGRGTHFDPAIVDAFVQASDEVRAIMESHMGRV